MIAKIIHLIPYQFLAEELKWRQNAASVPYRLIKETGGLRKLRWGLENKGKRGGIRVINYWQIAEDQFTFLHCTQKMMLQIYQVVTNM
jgi:hypothetical protein